MKFWPRLLTLLSVLTTTTYSQLPPPPGGLEAAWVDNSDAVLWWNEAPGADTYRVYRYDAANSLWQTIGDGLTQPIFTDLSAPPPPLQYAVTGSSAAGEGALATVGLSQAGYGDFTLYIYRPDQNYQTLTPTNAILRVAADISAGVKALVELGDSSTNLFLYEVHPQYDSFHTFNLTNLAPATQYFYKFIGIDTNELANSYSDSFWTPMTNRPPVATESTVTASESTFASAILSATDPDYPPQNLTFRISAPPARGTLSDLYWNSDGTFTVYYMANAGVRGTDSFQYVASDGEMDSVPATITITNIFQNSPPNSPPLYLNTPEDTPIAVSLTATDADGDLVSFYLDSPSSGVLSGEPPNVVWTPDPNFSGTAWFSYLASDGYPNGGTYSYVMMEVLPVNDPPTAAALQVSTDEDTPLAITPVFSDPDPSDNYTAAIASPPSHGIATASGLEITYTPATDFFGDDSFTYLINDGESDSTPATVAVRVNPVNDPGVLESQTITIAEDTVYQGYVVVHDVESDLHHLLLFAAPTNGVVQISGTNFTYAPSQPNFVGTDLIGFSAADDHDLAASGVAWISVTVTNVNDAPVAQAIAVAGQEDTLIPVTLIASDVDGDSLVFRIVTGPVNGVLTQNGANVSYTPDANFAGTDSFTYVANDGQIDSEVASATITVNPVDDLATAQSQSIAIAEDSSIAITLSATDIDGGPQIFAIVAPPAHGSLTGTPPTVSYTPSPNFFGRDSFSFSVGNGGGNTSQATISITVNSVNDAPVANSQTLAVAYNTATAIILTGSDVEGNTLYYSVLSSPPGGTLSGTPPNLTFTPAIGWSGTTSFNFKVNDGALDSASATVTIVVNGPGSVPASPTSLAATAISKTQINLAWTDASNNEDGFKIENSTNGSTWTQVGTVGPNVRTFSSTGLASNKLYYYRVRAYNVLGNSGYSNVASAKTLK